jgi:hypothetical protein
LSDIVTQDLVRLSVVVVNGVVSAARIAATVVRLSIVSGVGAGGAARSVKPSGR